MGRGDLLSPVGRRRSWVLLDRDGTINEAAAPGEYVTSPAELSLLPGAAEAIRQLNEQGLPVAVVTNQRGVARGQLSLEDLEEVHAQLRRLLREQNAHIDLILSCPHEEGTCQCRKPLPGLLRRASTLLELPLEEAVMIGDSEDDVRAAIAAGVMPIRLTSGETDTLAEVTAASLQEAVSRLRAVHDSL